MTDRQAGFGVGPIPWASIHAYAIRHEIDDLDEFDWFLALIRAMDDEYLKAKAA